MLVHLVHARVRRRPTSGGVPVIIPRIHDLGMSRMTAMKEERSNKEGLGVNELKRGGEGRGEEKMCGWWNGLDEGELQQLFAVGVSQRLGVG